MKTSTDADGSSLIQCRVVVDLTLRALQSLQRETGNTESALLASATADVQLLHERLSHNKCEVLILGEFKNGKSTFLNAMIGQRLLPTSKLPCTSLICTVEHTTAAESHFVVHPYGYGSTGSRQCADTTEECLHISRLSEFVDRSEEELAPLDSTGSHVRIFVPVPLLEHVTLVDSPGIAEEQNFDRMVAESQQRADAYVFVLSCTHFLSESETSLLVKLIERFHNDRLFIIVNKFDFTAEDEEEMDRTRSRCIKKIKALYESVINSLDPDASFEAHTFDTFKEERIFFVSSLNALKHQMGVLTGDADRPGVQEGLQGFQEFCQRFHRWVHGPVAQRKAAVFRGELIDILKRIHFYLFSSLERLRGSREDCETQLSVNLERMGVLDEQIYSLRDYIDQAKERLRKRLLSEVENFICQERATLDSRLAEVLTGIRLRKASDAKKKKNTAEEKHLEDLRRKSEAIKAFLAESKQRDAPVCTEDEQTRALRELYTEVLSTFEGSFNVRLRAFTSKLQRLLVATASPAITECLKRATTISSSIDCVLRYDDGTDAPLANMQDLAAEVPLEVRQTLMQQPFKHKKVALAATGGAFGSLAGIWYIESVLGLLGTTSVEFGLLAASSVAVIPVALAAAGFGLLAFELTESMDDKIRKHLCDQLQSHLDNVRREVGDDRRLKPFFALFEDLMQQLYGSVQKLKEVLRTISQEQGQVLRHAEAFRSVLENVNSLLHEARALASA